MSNLIYIADPMCSWCYGFGPELTRLLEGLPETPLDIVVGGLRANHRETMTPTLKATLLSHWQRVQEASGLPFRDEGISRDGFIYDSEPACRAVVAARMLAPDASLATFLAIQEAFYAGGQDVTRGEVLANVAADAISKAGFPVDAATFQATWASEAAIVATDADFEQTKRWGVSGFPTLVLQRGEKLDLVCAGYVKTEFLVEQLQALIDNPA
ncbi:DsbA family protein [soil metagenome]